jgi:hypothetical protein
MKTKLDALLANDAPLSSWELKRARALRAGQMGRGAAVAPVTRCENCVQKTLHGGRPKLIMLFFSREDLYLAPLCACLSRKLVHAEGLLQYCF